MNRITLEVDNAHLSTLLLFLKTLDYIEVKRVENNISSDQYEQEKLAKLNELAGKWVDERSAEEIIEEIEKEIHALKSMHNTAVDTNMSSATPRPIISKGDKKIDPKQLFGIWKNNPRSIEQLRVATWKRNWAI